jgi:hypothetical protein
MNTGVYRKKKSGKLYQFVLLARGHHTDVGEPDVVVYIPLRVEPEWAGTLRFCYVPRTEFETKFEYVGETLPDPVERQ